MIMFALFVMENSFVFLYMCVYIFKPSLLRVCESCRFKMNIENQCMDEKHRTAVATATENHPVLPKGNKVQPEDHSPV